MPCGRGTGDDRIEIAGFAQQVGDRARLVDRGDGAGHLDRAIGGAEIEPGDERPPGAFGHRVAAAPGTLEALVRDIGFGRHEGVPRQRHRKADGEAQVAIRRPAARLPATGDDAVGTQPDRRPQDLAGIIVERAAQVEQQMHRLRPGGGTIAGDTDPRPCGEFGADAAILQGDRIIARPRNLRRMVVARSIARPGLAGVARLERNRVACHGHHQHIAEIRMPGARKVRQRKALDRRVLVPIAGGMAVAGAQDAGGVRVGRKLHHAERRDRTGKGMAFAAGADHRIDLIVRRLGEERRRREPGQQRQKRTEAKGGHRTVRAFPRHQGKAVCR